MTPIPSFLAHQREAELRKGKSNAERLFSPDDLPSDHPIRNLLDPVSPAPVEGIYRYVFREAERAGLLDGYRSFGRQLLVVIDGTEYFSSAKVACEQCSHRTLPNGEGRSFHSVLTPVIVRPLPRLAIPLLSQIPVIRAVLFDQNVFTYALYVLVPISSFVLRRISLDLSIRSLGENPEAGDVAGLHVDRIRFMTILFSGVMCGIGGAFYSIGYLGMFTTSMIGGRGWIAFAICFLGNWMPYGALAGALIFGLAQAFAIFMLSLGNLVLPNELFIAIPYILTIILTVTRKEFKVPEQLGIPYRREG